MLLKEILRIFDRITIHRANASIFLLKSSPTYTNIPRKKFANTMMNFPAVEIRIEIVFPTIRRITIIPSNLAASLIYILIDITYRSIYLLRTIN